MDAQLIDSTWKHCYITLLRKSTRWLMINIISLETPADDQNRTHRSDFLHEKHYQGLIEPEVRVKWKAPDHRIYATAMEAVAQDRQGCPAGKKMNRQNLAPRLIAPGTRIA
jgi:hypothetical protein